MIGHDRDSLRRYYLNSWQKQHNQQPLDALEQQVVAVISEHPEYHRQLAQPEQAVSRDYLPEQGTPNPFLHMGLHLGLREQIATDRPAGIRAIYQQLCQRQSSHEAEHHMMECLAESIWLAQRQNSVPDEAAYLLSLHGLLK